MINCTSSKKYHGIQPLNFLLLIYCNKVQIVHKMIATIACVFWLFINGKLAIYNRFPPAASFSNCSNFSNSGSNRRQLPICAVFYCNSSVCDWKFLVARGCVCVCLFVVQAKSEPQQQSVRRRRRRREKRFERPKRKDRRDTNAPQRVFKK